MNDSKCDMLIRSPSMLSFDAAVQSCSVISSSLLNRASYGEARTLGDSLRMARLISKVKLASVTPSRDLHVGIVNFLASRYTLDQTHPLLSFIKFSSEYQLNNIRILVNVNGNCARAEYLNFYFGGSRRWTAVFCGAHTRPTDVFICEKPRLSHTIVMCYEEYYQCEDATCILLLYVCDTVDDCLGGEDETLCAPGVLQRAVFSFQNSSLYLPCFMYHFCNATFESPVKLHTICDGLMSYVVMLDEENMCIKRRVENINLRQLIDKWTYKQDTKDTDEFHEWFRLLKLQNAEDKAMDKPINQSAMYIEEFKIACQKSKYYTTFSEICKIRASGEQCRLTGRYSICPYMVCPGMFKCKSSYCIYMSLVCDGQKYCICGEDEVWVFKMPRWIQMY